MSRIMIIQKPLAQAMRDICAALAEVAKEALPCTRCGCRLVVVTDIGNYCPGCGALRGGSRDET